MRRHLSACLVCFGAVLFPVGPVTACDIPLAYTVGEVDSRYDLSREQFHRAIRDAANVWEEAAGRELFVRRPEADFRINLAYTELQRATERIEELEESTDGLRRRIERKEDRLQAARQELERKKGRFEAKVQTFQQDRRAYEDRVRRLKAAGGASPEEVAAMEDRRERLEERRQTLREKRNQLKELKGRVNRLAVATNALVLRYNRRVREAKQVAQPGREFHQGFYQKGGGQGESITIRQFDGPARLLFVLAHELGHALGIDHVTDPAAVMHYRHQSRIPERPSLTDADRKALREVCGEL